VYPESHNSGAVVVALVFGLARKSGRHRMPPQPSFACGRCRAVTSHNHRTIEAWRNGKTKFFCPACHAAWLQTQPHRERHQYSSGRSSGCLGIVALLATVPVSILLALANA
jgi:hypothetical protein